MYTLTAVTKTYRTKGQAVEALRGLDLTVADGDWLVVQGRTGGGKSTLPQIFGGLDRPTSGSVQFDGKELRTMPERAVTDFRATSIGFMFQSFNLIPTLSAAENVEAALIPRGGSAERRRSLVAEALDSVGLSDRAGHLPSELSGGQQQRVGIARALVKQPKVLLADEPTGNLDEDTRDDILTLLEQLWRERRLTIVLVTHDPTIAARAPRVAEIKSGTLTIRRDMRLQ